MGETWKLMWRPGGNGRLGGTWKNEGKYRNSRGNNKRENRVSGTTEQ